MRLLSLLTALLFALPTAQPAVEWSAAIGEGSKLVISATVPDGVYIHPYGNEPGATSLSLEGGYELTGTPVEKYEPSLYKGESVVTGKYELIVTVKGQDPTIKGKVVWMSCSGDECSMPQEWEFSMEAPAASAEAPSKSESNGIWALILEAILWGLAMILTPCVFPMVPMTVSFFLKNSSGAAAGRLKASLFGLFIVLLYTVPICIIIGASLLFGGQSVTADIFNWLATHWLPNLLFFVIFMVFAASLLGAFEIMLPSKWVNGSDKKSEQKGLGGIFFLALTLVLVSFSCTGPIVGTVLIKSTQGEFWAPMVTMLAFSIAFALPFTLLAFFPSVMKKLPKSGGWLNSVKVVLGFIEIALGLKFLSVADQTYHWHLLDREVYLAIWIVVFTLLGFYLLGKLRFANDSPLEKINVKRLVLAIATFSFVVYMIPGMWGAPLKALSGYLPPLETQDFVMGRAGIEPQGGGHQKNTLEMPYGLVAYDNIEEGLEAAKAQGKKVFVDITGYGCVNCREMEARVWSDPAVLERLRNDYVMVALYNDDKTVLPKDKWVTTPEGKVLKDVGRVNSYIARTRFGVNSQPAYALLDADGILIKPVRGYDLDIQEFENFIN